MLEFRKTKGNHPKKSTRVEFTWEGDREREGLGQTSRLSFLRVASVKKKKHCGCRPPASFWEQGRAGMCARAPFCCPPQVRGVTGVAPSPLRNKRAISGRGSLADQALRGGQAQPPRGAPRAGLTRVTPNIYDAKHPNGSVLRNVCRAAADGAAPCPVFVYFSLSNFYISFLRRTCCPYV